MSNMSPRGGRLRPVHVAIADASDEDEVPAHGVWYFRPGEAFVSSVHFQAMLAISENRDRLLGLSAPVVLV